MHTQYGCRSGFHVSYRLSDRMQCMRNVRISYILAFLFESWFYFGIWIFYYLRFTNFAGVGLAESIMLVTRITAEVPTGALADLMGKKKTIMLAFAISSVGYLLMGLATNYTALLFSIFVSTLASSFYSGSYEAIIYDSLKEEGKEDYFSKAIANNRSITLVAHAIAGIIGGYLYLVNPRLPFLLVATLSFVGIFLTLFLREPAVDTDKFNLVNFLGQTKQGFRQLFNTHLKPYIVILLGIGFFIVIMYEIMDDALAVGYGFKPTQLSYLWAFVSILAAIVSQATPRFMKIIPPKRGILLLSFGMGALLLLSPLNGLLIGGVLLTTRIMMQVIFKNFSVVIINQNIESKYRATTISTMVMLTNIPYAVSAFFIGGSIDMVGIQQIALFMGIGMLTLTVVYILFKLIFLRKTNE